jgi:hypothetical protein
LLDYFMDQNILVILIEHFLNSNRPTATGHRHFMKLLFPRIEGEDGIANTRLVGKISDNVFFYIHTCNYQYNGTHLFPMESHYLVLQSVARLANNIN